MKLYARKLNSLADLQEERRRLRGNPQPTETASGHAEAEMPKEEEPEVIEATEVPEGGGHPLLDMLHQFMPGGGNGGAASAISTGLMVFNLIPSSIKKKYLRMALKEFVGGYVAWKALQLGYKGGKVLLKNYQARKKGQQLRIYQP